MEIIDITAQNIDREHVCCDMGGSKGQVSPKKEWMKARYADGLSFKRLDARGKAFIEYIPAERAWCPIDAPGYLYIDCFWVAGQFKGQGNGARLLEECIADAKSEGKVGLCALSSAKKRPYLSDPKFLKHKGFQTADTALSLELLYLPLREDAPLPRFRSCAKTGRLEETGLVLCYTDQCPFAAKYAPILREVAANRGVELRLVHVETAEQAQALPCPATAFSLFLDGEFVTNEILSEKKFETFLEERGLPSDPAGK